MKRVTLVVVLVGFAATIGCQGRIAPPSAQAGSTVVIPLDGGPFGDEFGYDGEISEDYQRGTLVYQLDGPGGFALEN